MRFPCGSVCLKGKEMYKETAKLILYSDLAADGILSELGRIWEEYHIPQEIWRSSASLRRYLEPGNDMMTPETAAALRLKEIPMVARKAIGSGRMIAGEQLSPDCIWYQTMNPYSVVAAPFMMEGQPVGCLIICVKKQWVERTSESQLIQDLVTIASYQMSAIELQKRKTMLQRAEFKALQFQVNPHFLFNALNTISSVCREDPDEARELLVTLADYFRYNLDFESYLVPLSEELEHVRDYLRIEQARFEDKLEVQIRAPQQVPVQIPTLLIQPIVENAIRHGIRPDGMRVVHIDVTEEKDAFLVAVSDEGRGFPEAVLEKLFSGEAVGDRVGLANVHKRLKNMYGEEHGLIISSSSKGSTVAMRFYKNGGRNEDRHSR